jgi:hypothetical protein
MADSMSVYPVRTIRIASGRMAMLFSRNSAPLIPGMRWSAMMSATSSLRRISRASAPLRAVRTR